MYSLAVLFWSLTTYEYFVPAPLPAQAATAVAQAWRVARWVPTVLGGALTLRCFWCLSLLLLVGRPLNLFEAAGQKRTSRRQFVTCFCLVPHMLGLLDVLLELGGCVSKVK